MLAERSNESRLMRRDGFSPYVMEPNDIPDYLQNVFGYDGTAARAQKPAPTFEEVIGVLDAAIDLGLPFGSPLYSNGNRLSGNLSIQIIRQELIRQLADSLSIIQPRGVHAQLCRSLAAASMVENIVFVTTNYDSYIDNALTECCPGMQIDYGCQLDDRPIDRTKPTVALLKLHGSTNWLHCPNCGATYSALDRSTRACSTCVAHTWCEPLIVPPTYFKHLHYDAIAETWSSFRRALRAATGITFCGYSFPDADFHVKAELKRTELYSRRPLFGDFKLHVRICNNYPGKSGEASAREREAYERFFAGPVEYTGLSFEDFVAQASNILTASV